MYVKAYLNGLNAYFNGIFFIAGVDRKSIISPLLSHNLSVARSVYRKLFAPQHYIHYVFMFPSYTLRYIHTVCWGLSVMVNKYTRLI